MRSRDRWFTAPNVLEVLRGPPPHGWPHVKSIDEVFPGVFAQNERPDFIWDIFAAPTDLQARWMARGDVVFSWQPARAVIEVKGINTDFRDRLREFKPGACATPLDYLALRLKRQHLMKADRQIGAARGLIAGQESLGVLILVNQESDTLTRSDVLGVLERSLLDLPNIGVIVYLHDWCVTEPSWRERDDGTVVQLHRVSAVGDPSKLLNRLFLKELKRFFTIAFRSDNLGPSETVFVKTYPRDGRMFKVVEPATPENQGPIPGELWFDPEGRWSLE
jgi:hypothetical protein